MKSRVSQIHYSGKQDHRKALSDFRKQEFKKELNPQKKEKDKSNRLRTAVMKLRSMWSTINDYDHSLFIT